MFYNLTNHPSNAWTNEQKEAARALGGQIIDLPFPLVTPTADESEINRIAEEVSTQIPDGSVVLCQGEWSLTFRLTYRLLLRDIRVVVAASTRRFIPPKKDKETGRPVYQFKFVRFRQLSL